MARIRGVTEEEASPEIKELYAQQRDALGMVLNTTPVFSLRPTIRDGSSALSAGIEASGLIEPPLKYLLYTKTAWINGCAF